MNGELPGVKWFKSSYSETGSNCVEVAWLDGDMVGVRDSNDPTGPAFAFTPGEWDAFTADLRNEKLTRS